MFGSTRHLSIHTPSPPSSKNPDPRLPRGECRFILLHPELNGQRCSCQGFWLNKSIPLGSACECGHQACYHEATPLINPEGAVARDEYEGVVKRVEELEAILRERIEQEREAREAERNGELDKMLGDVNGESDLVGTAGEHEGTDGLLADRVNRLEDMLEKERAAREEEMKSFYGMVEGVYCNMGLAQRRIFKRIEDLEDKCEGVMDRAYGLEGDLEGVRSRVEGCEEVAMGLEDRLDGIDSVSDRRRLSGIASSAATAHEEDHRSITPEVRSRHASSRPAERGRERSPSATSVVSEGAQATTPKIVHTSPAIASISADHDSDLNSISAPVVRDGRSEPPAWTVLVCFTIPSPASSQDEAYHRPPIRQKLLTIYGLTPPSVHLAIRTFFSDLIPETKSWMPLLKPTHSGKHGMSIPRPLPQSQQQERDDWDVGFLKRDCSIVALAKGFEGPQDTLFITSCDAPPPPPLPIESDAEGSVRESEVTPLPSPLGSPHPQDTEVGMDGAVEERPPLLRGKRSMLKRSLSCTSASDLTSTEASTPATSTSNLGPIAIHPHHPNGVAGGGAKRFKHYSSVSDEGDVPKLDMSSLQQSREVA